MDKRESIYLPLIIVFTIVAALGATSFYIARQTADKKNVQKEKGDFKTTSQNDNAKTAIVMQPLISSDGGGVDDKVENKSDAGSPTHEISAPKTESDKDMIRNKSAKETPSSRQEAVNVDNAAQVKVPSAPAEKSPAVVPFKAEWASAIVNLYCKDKIYGMFASSGTGVVIDPRGIILTNAHVAEDFLFDDSSAARLSYPSSLGLPLNSYICTVRIGSPAYPRYRAQLLYIPGEWIREGVRRLYFPPAKNEDYVYGVKDYALLVITEPINQKESLPRSFPYLPFSVGAMSPSIGSIFYLMGYPARFLGEDSCRPGGG